MKMKYQIEHKFWYGWDILNKNDTYPTREKAQAEINKLINDTVEGYQFRIEKINNWTTEVVAEIVRGLKEKNTK